MVGDPGSPAKVALLRQRAEVFWTAFLKEDYENTYFLYDPFFRAKSNKHAYIATMGTVKYHSFEIKDIKVEGNVGYVTLNVVYSIPKTKFKQREFRKPDTPVEFEEHLAAHPVDLVLIYYDHAEGETKALVTKLLDHPGAFATVLLSQKKEKDTAHILSQNRRTVN
jgi:hypothetical protein